MRKFIRYIPRPVKWILLAYLAVIVLETIIVVVRYEQLGKWTVLLYGFVIANFALWGGFLLGQQYGYYRADQHWIEQLKSIPRQIEEQIFTIEGKGGEC